jgi:hypothetical protein
MSEATAAAKTYLASTVADVTTRAIFAGVLGNASPLDLPDAVLSGIQTGTTFVAPSIAGAILKRTVTNPRYCKSPWFNYVAGSVVSSAIITSVNYPLSKAAEARTKGKAQCSLKEFVGNFVDLILPNIAFPVISDRLEGVLPTAKNSAAVFLRRAAITGAASCGSVLANAPIAAVKNGTKLSEVGAQAIGAVLPGIVLTEAFVSAATVVGLPLP